MKQFVPFAHVADLILVPARGPDGLTLFLVERGAEGLDVSPVPAMDPGMRWATVRLEAVPVADDARLGARGRRGGDPGDLLRRGAVGAAAVMLGAARDAWT